MKYIFAFAIINILLIVPSQARTYEQAAWDVCTEWNNAEYRHRPGHKAMVCGADQTSNRAFWSWNASSTTKALETALKRCRAAYSYCVVFGTDSGWSDWARTTNANGGITRSEAAARVNAAAAVDVADPFMDAFIAGASGVISQAARRKAAPSGSQNYAPPNYRPRYGGNGGSNRCPGATIAVDENCRPLH